MNDRRQWLYHADCPQGRIFEGGAIAQAVKDGWLDSPALIGAQPAKPESTDEPQVTHSAEAAAVDAQPEEAPAKPKRGAKAS